MPHDLHGSSAAVSAPPPSPLGSTSVSFHCWSTMSVISACHLRHEVSRPSYLVSYETPLVANAPAAKRTLQSRLPVCDFAVAQVDSAARARVPTDILRAGPAGFPICVSECAKCARRRRSARRCLRGRRPARNRCRTRCRGSGSSRWTRWVGLSPRVSSSSSTSMSSRSMSLRMRSASLTMRRVAGASPYLDTNEVTHRRRPSISWCSSSTSVVVDIESPWELGYSALPRQAQDGCPGREAVAW